VAESEREDVIRAVGSRGASRTVVILNGIALPELPTSGEREALRAELNLTPETVAAVTVGSLDRRKDPLTPARAAVDVAAGGKHLALLIVGEGPLRSELENIEREMPAVVRVLGYRSDVERILRAADLYVVSSEREGLSFALLEAMSLGLPAVASTAPGNAEALGGAGLLVPSGDVEGFAAAFSRFADSETERRELGGAARGRVRELFRHDEMVRRTSELYEDVLAGRRA
jgi:glycosyltransferase involved in cell wall biosynthesis